MKAEIRSGLLEFNARNVASFEGDLQISFRATPMALEGVARTILASGRDEHVLPALAILGPNASGKSNVLHALYYMRFLVMESFKSLDASGGIPRFSFKGAKKNSPSIFEIELVIDNIWYRYGFEIDDNRVLSEWADFSPNGRKIRLFRRTGQVIQFGSRNLNEWKLARSLIRKRENSLLLSAAMQMNHPAVLPLQKWLEAMPPPLDDDSDEIRRRYTAYLNTNPKNKAAITELLQAADLGISELTMKDLKSRKGDKKRRMDNPSDSATIRDDADPDDFELKFIHRLGEKLIEFDEGEESRGTLAWIALIGPIYQALKDGSVLLVDELGDRLHPNLVQQIISIFQRRDTNPNFGQIIFNGHSLAVLNEDISNDESGGKDVSKKLLGRDQIYFTEKDYSGSSRIFRLSDLAPRPDAAILKRYLDGQYGAVPTLDFHRFLAVMKKSRK